MPHNLTPLMGQTQLLLNPYKVGTPVAGTDFYGRSEFLTRVRQALTPSNVVLTSRLFSPIVHEGGSLALYGERFMGKSLMLSYIAEPPADWQTEYFQHHIFVCLNCMDVAIPFAPGQFWVEVVKQVDRKLLDRKLAVAAVQAQCQALLQRAAAGAELAAYDFQAILDVAGQAGKRIVLVLDDFDGLIRTDPAHFDRTRGFLQGLRALTTRNGYRANLVVATRHSLYELCKPLAVQSASPFDNGFVNYRLQLFREAELMQLLQRVEQTEQPPFSAMETRYVAYLSGYHPQLAQIAAAEIFDRRLDQGAPLTDLTAVGEKFKSDARPVFDSLWAGASEIERILLMLIALRALQGKTPTVAYDLSDLSTILSQRERELVELTQRGLLNRTQANPPQWEIFSPLFQWWILKEIECGDPEQLRERRKVWGNLIAQKRADQLGQIVDFLKKNKEAIESVGRSILQMAGWQPPKLGGS